MRKFLLTVFSAIALAASALTLDEARSIASERYPLMRDYGIIALTEQYTVENASKAWLPQVALGAQGTWQSAVASYPDVLTDMLSQRGLDMKGMSKLQYKVSVDVRQTIYDGGRIKATQEATRAENVENRLQTDVELYQLRSCIDDIYFGILLLENQREALNATLTLLQANLDKVNSLLRNGAAMQSDADAVEAELLSTRQQLTSVSSAIAAYRAVLGLYLGTDGNESLEIPSARTLPTDNDFASRPEQLLLNARLRSLDAQESLVMSSLRPRISAFAQGFYGYPGLNFMDAMMSHSPKFGAMVGLSAAWDITSFYTKKGNLNLIAEARRRISVARETFDFNADLQATRQRQEIDRLRRISEADAEIVVLRTRVRQASEARLREGVVEPTDLLLRITEEKNAMIAASSHRIEYLKAIYSLLTTLNQ